MIKPSNDNRQPPFWKRLRIHFTRVRIQQALFDFTDAFASAGLGLHFLLFLGLQFAYIDYLYFKILAVKHHSVIDGFMKLSIPEREWKGFLWLTNFYGGLIIITLALWLLFYVWERSFRKKPYLRIAHKTLLCMFVGLGAPLKLLYNVNIGVPASFAPDFVYLEEIHVTDIAKSPLFSLEGAWFLSKFAVLPPVLFLVLLIMRQTNWAGRAVSFVKQ